MGLGIHPAGDGKPYQFEFRVLKRCLLISYCRKKIETNVIYKVGFQNAFIAVCNPQPYGEIFALRLADGFTVRLTHNKWEDGTPSWGILP